MPKLQLKIFTSESIKFDEPVDMIIMRCVYDEVGKKSITNEIGILPGHLPFSAVLGKNGLRILNDGDERVIAVFGGVVNVQDDVVTILTEKAAWPHETESATTSHS